MAGHSGPAKLATSASHQAVLRFRNMVNPPKPASNRGNPAGSGTAAGISETVKSKLYLATLSTLETDLFKKTLKAAVPVSEPMLSKSKDPVLLRKAPPPGAPTDSEPPEREVTFNVTSVNSVPAPIRAVKKSVPSPCRGGAQDPVKGSQFKARTPEIVFDPRSSVPSAVGLPEMFEKSVVSVIVKA